MLGLIVVAGLIGFLVWMIKGRDKRVAHSDDTIEDDVIEFDPDSIEYIQGYRDGYKKRKFLGTVDPLKQEDIVFSEVDDGSVIDEKEQKGASKENHTREKSHKSSAKSAATTAKSARTHKKKINDNHVTINIALYIASLLLASGVVLMTYNVTMLGSLIVWLIVAAYYITGLVVYNRFPMLKPAALAFVGTALISLPVAGSLLHTKFGVDPLITWLIVSLSGAIVYVHATMRLNSQILAYVSLASVLSVFTAVPAVLNAQIVWYYIALIVFGSLLAFLAKNTWITIPEVFAKPIKASSAIIVPVALVLSLVTASGISWLERGLVTLAGCVFYAASAYVAKSKEEQNVSWLVSRILSIIGVGLVSYGIAESYRITSIVMFIVACMHVGLSVYKLTPRVRVVNHHESMIWIALVTMTLIAPAMMLRDPGTYTFVVVQHIATVAIGIVAIVRLRRLEFLLPIALGITMATYHCVVNIFDFSSITTIRTLSVLYMVYALILVTLRCVLIKRKIRNFETAWVYCIALGWAVLATLMIMGAQVGPVWWLIWSLLLSVVLLIACLCEKWPVLAGVIYAALLLALYNALNTIGPGEQWVHVMSVGNAIGAIAVIEYIRRTFSGSFSEKVVQIAVASMFGFGLMLALISLLNSSTAIQLFGWLPYVAVAYYTFYLYRQAVLLAFAHIIYVVAVAVILHFIGIAIDAVFFITAIVAFVSLVLGSYGGKKLGKDNVNATWLSGSIAAACFAGLCYLNTGAQHWMNMTSAWLAVIVLVHAYYKLPHIAGIILVNSSIVIGLLSTASWLRLDAVQAVPFIGWLSIIAIYSFARLVARKNKRMYIAALACIATFVLCLFIVQLSLGVASNKMHVGLMMVVVALIAASYDWDEGKLKIAPYSMIMALLGLDMFARAVYPDISSVVIAHLWSLGFGVNAILYYLNTNKVVAKRWLIGALFSLSVPLGLKALSGDQGMQIWFLVEHVIMIIAGLVRSYRLAVIWGTVAVGLALVNMLSGYMQILVIILGLAIIAGVVFTIVRDNRRSH